MFGARASAVLGSNFNAALIIFKDSAMDRRGGDIEVEPAKAKFRD